MNKLTIIGNLTKDPEQRVTQSGIALCTFTVAVNRRRREGQEPEADFFRVTAWRQLGETCGKHLAKGRKVAVTGPVSISTYQAQDGSTRANMEVTADDVEFLTPKAQQQPQEAAANAVQPAAPENNGYYEVDGEELPWG